MRWHQSHYHPERPVPGSVTGQNAYGQAERMLDRYGIAYLCQHPEILLGRLPVSGPDHRAYARYRGPVCGSYDVYSPAAPGTRRRGEDELLVRVAAAYQILEEIFAPYRPATVEPRRRYGATSSSTGTGEMP